MRATSTQAPTITPAIATASSSAIAAAAAAAARKSALEQEPGHLRTAADRNVERPPTQA